MIAVTSRFRSGNDINQFKYSTFQVLSFFSTTQKDDSELFVHFLQQQNRFLSSMMDEALSTVLRGVDEIKQLQLSQSHEVLTGTLYNLLCLSAYMDYLIELF